MAVTGMKDKSKGFIDQLKEMSEGHELNSDAVKDHTKNIAKLHYELAKAKKHLDGLKEQYKVRGKTQ